MIVQIEISYESMCSVSAGIEFDCRGKSRLTVIDCTIIKCSTYYSNW